MVHPPSYNKEKVRGTVMEQNNEKNMFDVRQEI